MKIGAVTLCLNDEDTIAGTINCLKGFVDYHIVLISEKSYFGDVYDNGKSEKICDSLGVDYIKGFWPLDHYQRTLGNKLCNKNGCDWVITLDSDEMIDRNNLERLRMKMYISKERALATRPECYWHDIHHVLRPIPDYAPIIATKSDVEFPYIRNVNCHFNIVDIEMHHVSWAAPKDVYKKVTCYAHATDFDGKKWYEENYKNWIYPHKAVLPDREYNVIKKDLPDELVTCYIKA